jgi:hypothetical protein
MIEERTMALTVVAAALVLALVARQRFLWAL